MPRALVLVPQAGARLAGAAPIGPDYPRSYTPAEMRGWADDLARLYQTSSRELSEWRALPPSRLSREQRGVLAAQDGYFGDAGRAIKGSLRGDGRVDLDGGRHRVAYLLERGVDPVPVWVTSSDARALERFEADCHNELARARPARRAIEEHEAGPAWLGRHAVRGAEEAATRGPGFRGEARIDSWGETRAERRH